MFARVRRRPHADAPLPALAYLCVCLALASWWSVVEIGHLPVDTANLARVAVLIVVAVVFEEGSTRAARLRVRIGGDLTQDLTSVWSFGAAIAAPRGWAVVLIAVVLAYKWIRQDRPAGMPTFRWVFNTTNVVLTTLVTSEVFHLLTHAWAGLPVGLDGFLPALVAMLAYAMVNRALVTGFLVSRGVSGSQLIGSRDENLIEFATLCLGGLVALAVIYQPWLVVFALAPMVALERGARLRVFEAAASTDAKTGLLNAAAWEHVATQELARAIRTSSSVAVAIIDIDRFKLVNDSFGHLAGDKVLREIGRRLSAGVREYDTVGRFGGEEFVAVLPEADASTGLMVAERLRAVVNELCVGQVLSCGGDDWALSVSIGLATVQSGDDEVSDLLAAADAALYRAKRGGRNRVELAGPNGGPEVLDRSSAAV